MAFDFREYGAVNYRRILRILIAYSAFLNAYEYYLPKKEKGTDYTPIGTVNKSFYCLQSKDYNNLQVKKRITDNEFEILSLKQFYGEINLSDDVITLITSRYLCKPCSIDSLKLYKNPYKPNFVVGSGVSYKIGSRTWDEIIDEMAKVFKSRYRINTSGFDEIKKRLFNTTYGVPQMLKNLNKKEYNRVLYESIYPNQKLNVNANKTLQAVADKIVYRNNTESSIVITFNYDDFLERSLIDRQKKTSYYSRFSQYYENGDIPIVHLHGFLDSNIDYAKQDDNFKTIVLTNDEYMDAYSSSGKYSASTILKKQLSRTCFFIGNSIADYEEQKVIQENYNQHKASFHYMLQSRYGDKDAETFVEHYFLLKGLIVLWFNSNDDIASFITNNIKYD